MRRKENPARLRAAPSLLCVFLCDALAARSAVEASVFSVLNDKVEPDLGASVLKTAWIPDTVARGLVPE